MIHGGSKAEKRKKKKKLKNNSKDSFEFFCNHFSYCSPTISRVFFVKYYLFVHFLMMACYKPRRCYTTAFFLLFSYFKSILSLCLCLVVQSCTKLHYVTQINYINNVLVGNSFLSRSPESGILFASP